MIRPLTGSISVPGDKSISHRAVMFGSIAKGDTRIRGFLNGADCLSTIDCFRRLGIRILTGEKDGLLPDEVIVHGNGMHGLSSPDHPVRLYTGNSGTTTRIMSGILSPQGFESILSGDDSVNRRPMKRVIEPLRMMGADIRSMDGTGCAPILIKGSPLHGMTYTSPVASAQVKSAILCAGLYADAPTAVLEPALSRDHTERMLRAFGADTASAKQADGLHAATVLPCEELYGTEVTVPGDISSAAFLIVAALLLEGSDLIIRNVGINPTRDGILTALKAMGADITTESERKEAEPSADLHVRYSSLKGTVIGGSMIPSLIDELPVLAVAASAAEGTTVIRDAAELKVKESDRIELVTENLRAMGADITATEDGFIIQGPCRLHGARIRTAGDHRIAMSFAVAGLAAEGETLFDDPGCVSVSYPGFFEEIQRLQKDPADA